VKITLNITQIITATDAQGNKQNSAYQEIKKQFEPALLRELLAHTKNNKTHSARIAGINVSTLNSKLKQHGLVVKKQVRNRGVK
jgi:DNA-binding protein Fis